MSDESASAPEPSGSTSLLLEPERPVIADYAIPIGLGALGVGLIAYSMRKGSGGKKKGKKLKAEDSEVLFGPEYKSFSIGDDWMELTLEPFLAEQAEENKLITVEYQELMTGMTEDQLAPILAKSRKDNLKVFFSTTKVKTPKGDEYISKLPGTKAVSEFKKILDDETKEFQEEY